MAILRQIALLGQPVLRQKALPLDDPGGSFVQSLIEDMLVTLVEANGVGLAAPQVFEPLRLIIVASSSNPRYPDAPAMAAIAMINPELLWQSDEIEKGWEGCLSIPGLRGVVPRHKRIGIRYLDRGGEPIEAELSGFPARVFQHELDHIEGIVFIDRIESSRDLIMEKEYMRMLTGGKNNE
jgi:peptide deformylase